MLSSVDMRRVANMSSDEVSADQMTVDKMTVDKMTVDKMTVDKMITVIMTLDETTCNIFPLV
jgi:hypothetical protein